MAMTGKYEVDDAPVVISTEVETAFLARLELAHEYDDAKDVVFCCCADGLVADVPVKNGANEGQWPLNFRSSMMTRGGKTFIDDLKAIYDGKTATADRRRTKAASMLSMPADA